MTVDVPAQTRAEPRRIVDTTLVLEAYVERVARLVLHSAALADRMQARPTAGSDPSRTARLGVLGQAVDSGACAIAGAVRHHARPVPLERRQGLDRRVVNRK